MKLNFLVNDLGLAEFSPIVDRVLNLKPLIGPSFPAGPRSTTPIARLGLEQRSKFRKMVLHGGEPVDIDSTSRENHPQTLPVRCPAIDVLSPEKRHQYLRTFWIGRNESLFRRCIN